MTALEDVKTVLENYAKDGGEVELAELWNHPKHGQVLSINLPGVRYDRDTDSFSDTRQHDQTNI